MFCPNCGANNSTEHKYCRSCGLNIEKIGEILLQQIPSAESAELMKRHKNIEKIGTIGLTGIGIVGLFGIGAMIYSILIKMILSGTNIIGGIIIITFLIFAVMSLIYVVYMKALEDTEKKLKRAKKIEVFESKKTAELLEEKPFSPVPSITESTTKSLHIEQKNRKFQ